MQSVNEIKSYIKEGKVDRNHRYYPLNNYLYQNLTDYISVRDIIRMLLMIEQIKVGDVIVLRNVHKNHVRIQVGTRIESR